MRPSPICSGLIALALCAGVGLDVRGMQEPTPNAPKPDVPATSAKDPTPEATLRSFLIAVMAQDEPTLRSITLPNQEIDWLLKGKPMTMFQAIVARTTIVALPIRALKPGDEVTLPGGRKLVVGPDEVTETRAVLVPEGAPLPTRLRKVEGVWKVDARPIIAARKAAEAARLKREAKKG